MRVLQTDCVMGDRKFYQHYYPSLKDGVAPKIKAGALPTLSISMGDIVYLKTHKAVQDACLSLLSGPVAKLKVKTLYGLDTEWLWVRHLVQIGAPAPILAFL